MTTAATNDQKYLKLQSCKCRKKRETTASEKLKYRIYLMTVVDFALNIYEQQL